VCKISEGENTRNLTFDIWHASNKVKTNRTVKLQAPGILKHTVIQIV